ncbi:hypothetical protein OG397_40845 [Streptomyces sp. NBC_00728]
MPPRPTHRQLALADDRHVPGLRALADAVHLHGTLICMALNHGGRTTHPAVSGHQPVAPSPVPCQVTGGALPRDADRTRREVLTASDGPADPGAHGHRTVTGDRNRWMK